MSEKLRLAVLTPFEGKGWALDRWLGALKAAELPADTQLVWLCNSADDAFYQRLEAASHTMPWPVMLWRDSTKVTGPTVHTKDATVAYLWRELRKRIPSEASRVLTLEDDVLPSPGTVAALFALAEEHGADITVAVTPVPCRVSGQSPDGAWVYRDGGTYHAERHGRSGRVDCATFGCMLYPRSLFDRLPLLVSADSLRPGYDNQAGRDTYRLGGQMIAGWEIHVEHMEHPPDRPATAHYAGAARETVRPQETQAQKIRRARQPSYAQRAWRGQRP